MTVTPPIKKPAAQEKQLHVDAPAKINLYLEVKGNRPDGFHEIVTIMQTIDMVDRITLTATKRSPGDLAQSADIQLAVHDQRPPKLDHHDLPPPEDNLACRAAAALLDAAQATSEVAIHIDLVKKIPLGGGLGGGSSDAASVLMGVNQLLGNPVGENKLRDLAAQLGSDIPFFLTGGTALCTGRGEIVRPIVSPQPFDVELLFPGIHSPTAEIYNELPDPPVSEPNLHDLEKLVKIIDNASPRDLEQCFRNDLEDPASHVIPKLRPLLALPGWHLSGSGSTLFSYIGIGADSATTERIDHPLCVMRTSGRFS